MAEVPSVYELTIQHPIKHAVEECHDSEHLSEGSEGKTKRHRCSKARLCVQVSQGTSRCITSFTCFSKETKSIVRQRRSS